MAGSSSSGGIGVVGLLGVVFVTLKLCDVVDWSWWWVLLPFYGGITVVLALAIIALAVLACSGSKENNG